jgi:hypothetical protein
VEQEPIKPLVLQRYGGFLVRTSIGVVRMCDVSRNSHASPIVVIRINLIILHGISSTRTLPVAVSGPSRVVTDSPYHEGYDA